MALYWEAFKGGPTRPENHDFGITINHKSVLTFNRFAVNELNNADAVKLLFEKKESLIGIVASSLNDKDAFPLKPKNSVNWVVNAAPFCRHHKIVIEKTEKFDHPVIDEKGILWLDLKATHDVSVRRKRG
ncbi:MAG: hypothetical protein IPL32_10305 [Chloracidobacterium sp.]|nr:hypothetical protein [Chloracidobacterium sp.]